MRCYLRFQSDYLADAKPCKSIGEAEAEFEAVASELARYGQTMEATIHVAPSAKDLQEYPDFLLTLSENGRVVRVET